MRFLILGLDEGFNRSGIGYTDTIILVSISSLKRKIVLFSIPRDLWISVSDREENRIGAVYAIAETKELGEGASTVTALVDKIFQVPVHYYILVKMQGFINIVDSLGGVDITLSQPMVGYPVGITHLNGQAALAFARDRAKTDDFVRMLQSHILIKGIISQFFKVTNFRKLLQILGVLKREIKSNIPPLEWIRLTFTLIFAHPNEIESYTITREEVSPTITTLGEKVINPDWNKIRRLTQKIFGK